MVGKDEEEKTKLTLDQMWTEFSARDSHFSLNYPVYHHFRSKSWVVKEGTKFGADFLLYKHGPPFYHASYSVLVEESDKNKLSWNDLSGLNRVTESAAKELLLAKVGGQFVKSQKLSDIESVEVKEILIRRWVPAQEREDN